MKRVEEVKQQIETEMDRMMKEYLYEYHYPEVEVTIELDDYEILKLKKREQK